MPIHSIASIVHHKNQLGIGFNNQLLVNIPEDLKRFKRITTGSVVVMGRKTWDSLPKTLPNRINIVLSHTSNVPLPSLEYGCVYFTNFKYFMEFYTSTHPEVFVIGGSEIYKLFTPDSIFLTEVIGFKGPEPTVFIEPPNEQYTLHNTSDTFSYGELKYRFLDYRRTPGNKSEENKYLDLCRQILKIPHVRQDRTKVGTLSIFGTQLHFDISSTVPLFTTKRVAWKHCIEELLWFLRGDTDAKILQNKKIKIWDGNTSRQFLDSRGLKHYDEGILGPGYGWCWRFYGAEYSPEYSDTSKLKPSSGFDQIQYVLKELQENPFSRRILVTAWNPTQMDSVALLPCHYSFQFYVEEQDGQRYLSCHFIMRSNDLGCGFSFNIFSYTVLTYIIALKCNMKPKKLVYTCSDTHIYTNHIEAIQTQIERTPNALPKLWVNPNVASKDFADIDITDFDIIGYFPHSPIKMEMAV